MRFLGMIALAGTAYWFFGRKKEAQTNQTNQTSPLTQLKEADLYKKMPYSVSMGVRG